MTSNTFYDHRGNVIASSSPTGLWSKRVIDGVDRVIESYQSDGGVLSGATINFATASSVSNDIVLSQTDTTYDANGNAILTADHERLPGDPQSGTGSGGPLGDATGTGGPAADVYYVAMYYDAADRPTDSVNVGTNGGAAYARPSSVPVSSDSTLVTHTDYDAAGRVLDTIDPRGIVGKNLYDLLGRTTTTIAAYTDGTPTSNTNQTTTYTYDGDGNVLTMTAVMPTGTPSQTTAYVYGTGSTSGIFSNDLLAKVEYPDATTGAASTAATDDVSYTYNALGQKTGMTDQNGNIHAYSCDALGRQTLDAVTTLGLGVDGSVRAIGTSFNSQGLPYQKTSYSDAAGTTIANQVQDVYNGLGQLTGEYQSHSGAVNTGSTGSPPASTTPEVQYGYSDPSLGSRQTSMTYPNGRVLNTVYNTGLDTAIGRVSALADSGGSAAGTDESYSYQGLRTVIGTTDGNGVTKTITLDPFGRTAEIKYVNASSVTTDDFQYGYDRNGNVLYKNNLLSSSNSELYHTNSAVTDDNNTAYDPLNRLTGFARGTLSSSGNNGTTLDTVTTAGAANRWNLDALGNWNSSTEGSTTATRANNSKNQITSYGGISSSYDADGNLLTDPLSGNTYTYDAWNRLANATSGSATIDSYLYDASGRRISENNGTTASDRFYSPSGQVIEERAGSSTTRQYVWSLSFVNDLVLAMTTRPRQAGGSGSGLGRRLYGQRDDNHNLIALTDSNGNVLQRELYGPYGGLTVLTVPAGASPLTAIPIRSVSKAATSS